MSILIKNMEMPTSPVLFCIHPDGKVFADLEGGWREYKAIPVPPHGRLIDADTLYEKFLRLESEAMSALQTTSIGSVDGIKWSAILTERTGYKFDIVDAPTIIPAELITAEEEKNDK